MTVKFTKDERVEHPTYGFGTVKFQHRSGAVHVEFDRGAVVDVIPSTLGVVIKEPV